MKSKNLLLAQADKLMKSLLLSAKSQLWQWHKKLGDNRMDVPTSSNVTKVEVTLCCLPLLAVSPSLLKFHKQIGVADVCLGVWDLCSCIDEQIDTAMLTCHFPICHLQICVCPCQLLNAP